MALLDTRRALARARGGSYDGCLADLGFRRGRAWRRSALPLSLDNLSSAPVGRQLSCLLLFDGLPFRDVFAVPHELVDFCSRLA